MPSREGAPVVDLPPLDPRHDGSRIGAPAYTAGRGGRQRWLARLHALTWITTVGGVGWALVQLLGLQLPFPVSAAMTFTPYLALAAWVPALAGLLLRRWPVTAVALVVAVVLAAGVIPRTVAGRPPAAEGPVVRVLSANLFFGNADAETLVGHVADERIDVLTVLELDDAGIGWLDAAGLDDLLPHRYLLPLDGGRGSGIYSRFPLEPVDDVGSGGVMRMPRARIAVPGAPPVEVVAVHPVPPTTAHDTGVWRLGLSRLPVAGPDAPLRVLAGDFNATLDHAELRSVIDDGYVDAGAVRGDGLRPTWPADRRIPPGVALDHVLADRRIEVRAYDVVDLPGSDHRGVLAELRLPALPDPA